MENQVDQRTAVCCTCYRQVGTSADECANPHGCREATNASRQNEGKLPLIGPLTWLNSPIFGGCEPTEVRTAYLQQKKHLERIKAMLTREARLTAELHVMRVVAFVALIGTLWLTALYRSRCL